MNNFIGSLKNSNLTPLASRKLGFLGRYRINYKWILLQGRSGLPSLKLHN